MRPAAQWLSFASPKESHQRKGDPTRCVPALRFGQPAVLASSGVSLELASLRQSRALIRWPLRSSAHPEGNPKPDSHTGHRCARPPTRAPCAPQAHPEGVGSKQPFGPSLRSAGRSRRAAPACWGPSAAKARVDVRFPGFPSRCAEERSGQRIRARDCLSATQWSEFERDPAGREHRRLPEAKRRDAACRVAFSLVTFFWRSKRKLLARRATPGL